MNTPVPKVIQIVPAPGWLAVYSADSGELKVPLAIWALFDDGRIEGLEPEEFLTGNSKAMNFLRYEHKNRLEIEN